MRPLHLFALLLVICGFASCGEENHDNNDMEKCIAFVTPDIDYCKTYGHPKLHSKQCISNSICNKTFNATVINIQPHSSKIIPDLISNLMEMCCGICSKMNIIQNISDVVAINYTTFGSSHFVFPVIGYADHAHLFGFSFLPLTDQVSAYYINKMKTNKEIIARVVDSAANLWPLLIICLLMAVIAGFPVWMIETWTNKSEFPRPFIVGLFEGFWWSFVSMTTVGYGDKAPKFFVSRLLAVMWILIGITMCSLFTASLTNEITSVYKDEAPVFTDLKVGVLKGRIFDASIATNGGAYVVVSEKDGLIPGVFDLLEKLQRKEISGLVLDKHTYLYTIQEMRNIVKTGSGISKQNARFFLESTHSSEVKPAGQNMVYGVLIKDYEDYEYFRHFEIDNRPILQTCKELQLNNIEPLEHDEDLAHNMFNEDGVFFQKAVTVTVIIIAVIFVFGIAYEIGRWIIRNRRTNPSQPSPAANS